MGLVKPIVNGYYHLVAYTESPAVPRFLYHDNDRNVVVCREEPQKTQWAVHFEGVQPPGYFLWRHPILGHLLDHNVNDDTVSIRKQNEENQRSYQTWTIRKHAHQEYADSYYYTLKPLSGENAGFLTRGQQTPGRVKEWSVSVEEGSGLSRDAGPEQRWFLVYIPQD